jgi:IS5 family transposase
MNKGTGRFDKKAIRILVTTRLKAEHPNFNKLKRKEKRRIVLDACKAAEKAIKGQEMDVPELTAEELLGLGKRPKGIMTLEEMARFIENHERTLIPFPSKSRKQYVQNPLLRYMDELLNDSLLDRLLAPPGMTASMRDWMPSRLLRIELLRTALFPEWSVRKFCGYLSELSRKEERSFCNLPLHRKEICDHSTLSTFRASLTFEMRVNLMVLMAHHFLASDRLGDSVLHMMDSTDVAEPVNPSPLCKIEMPDGSFIRFYADLSCDCGSRRNKRDKSKMFVGYRVHTLCVADVESGIAFPLLSLAVAANPHDSQVLEPLLSVGIELKVLSADEAYADADKQTALREEHGLLVVTPSKSKADVPGNVDSKTGYVFLDGACETPMRWDGYDKDDGGHVFVCDNDACPRAALCAKERIIPIDTGLFGPVPRCIPGAQKTLDARKVAERPFNLLKHMDGLEPCRMKTHATVSAQMVFSQMTGIFKVMAGLRSMPKSEKENRQEVLPFAANG